MEKKVNLYVQLRSTLFHEASSVLQKLPEIAANPMEKPVNTTFHFFEFGFVYYRFSFGKRVRLYQQNN